MKVIVQSIDGLSLAARGDSNHWVAMDAAADVGGADGATRPMELMLMGLGGCTAMDVLSILKKKRVILDDFECQIEAERAQEHPKIFTRIRIKYIFYGENLPREAVERAIELSETTYCSASAMLRKSAEMVSTYEIRPAKNSA